MRLLAAVVAVVVGGALLGVKFWAWRITGSSAVLSDALESIVNVVAAFFAIGSVVFAGRPADRNHPYGHGKIEFLAAAFEGGLISFAALLILFEAAKAFIQGPQLERIGLGLVLVLGAGLVNAGLGWFLVRTGRRYNSLTLVADGKHVLSDFLTSLGVVAGLILVRLTGILWLDPLVAALVGLNLAWTGVRLVRHAAGGLLDEEDPAMLERLVEALDRVELPGIVRVHDLRAIRAGRFHHIDAHLVVPEFWSVERAHELSDLFEARVMDAFGKEGEIVFHIDPCRREYCNSCELAECGVRRAEFAGRRALTLEEAIQPDPPRNGA